MRYIPICEEVDPDMFPRLVHASLLLSNSIRRDTIVCINVRGIGTIKIEGSKARRIYPDEESLLGLLKALKRGKRLYGIELINSCCKPSVPSVPCISLGDRDKVNTIRGDIYLMPWKDEKCYQVAGLERFDVDQRIIVLQSVLDRWLK